jgi:hypothetical protein
VSSGSSRTANWGWDAGLSFRMFGVMFLLAALYLGFMAVLIVSGVEFIFIGFIDVAMLGIQYFFSDRLALWSVGAKEVSPEQAPELHAMVERLAQTSDQLGVEGVDLRAVDGHRHDPTVVAVDPQRLVAHAAPPWWLAPRFGCVPTNYRVKVHPNRVRGTCRR